MSIHPQRFEGSELNPFLVVSFLQEVRGILHKYQSVYMTTNREWADFKSGFHFCMFDCASRRQFFVCDTDTHAHISPVIMSFLNCFCLMRFQTDKVSLFLKGHHCHAAKVKNLYIFRDSITQNPALTFSVFTQNVSPCKHDQWTCVHSVSYMADMIESAVL